MLEGLIDAADFAELPAAREVLLKLRSRFWSWRLLPMAVTLGTSVLLKSISKFSRLATSVIPIWQTCVERNANHALKTNEDTDMSWIDHSQDLSLIHI